MSQHQISYVDTLRNVNSLFSHYDSRKQSCMQLLRNGSSIVTSLWGKYLDTDSYCNGIDCNGIDCNRNRNTNPNTSSRSCPIPMSYCAMCKSLTFLCDVRKQCTFTVETGPKRGTRIKIVHVPLGINPYLVPHRRSTAINILLKEQPIYYVALDPTTSDLLVSWCIEGILPGIPRIYTAYECRNNVTIIRDDVTPLSECTLNQDQWNNLVFTIVSNLKSLNPYSFTIGMPSPESILVGSNNSGERNHISVCYNLGGMSSISTSDVRLVSTVEITDVIRTTQLPNLYDVYSYSGVELYSLRANVIVPLTRLRMSGIPILSGSYELYHILVGIYCHPNGRIAIDTVLGSGWRNMWLGLGDFEAIRHRTSGRTALPGYYEISGILAGLWLRPDALSVL